MYVLFFEQLWLGFDQGFDRTSYEGLQMVDKQLNKWDKTAGHFCHTRPVKTEISQLFIQIDCLEFRVNVKGF